MVFVVDLGVGEKERGILEILFILFMDCYKLVFGKFFIISCVGLIIVLIIVLFMVMWGIVLL